MIILSTLGLGPFNKETRQHEYTEETYTWNGATFTTALFQAALATWFPGAQTIVLCTEKATRLRAHELEKAIPGVRLLDIPDGRSDEQFWLIFNTIAEAIPEGETVILDITHGFRSLPVLGLLALSFLRIAKNVTIEHVFYGALDAREPGSNVVEVFDLAPFLTMFDWANATDRFLDTGDARKIAPLITVKRKNPLNEVAASMEELSEAVALMRGGLTLEKARKLKQKVDLARSQDWDVCHTPLRLLLDRIEERFGPMGETLALKAQWEQIRWLSNHGHYPAAASLAREWLVTVRVMFISDILGEPLKMIIGKTALAAILPYVEAAVSVDANGTGDVPIVNELRKTAETWLNSAEIVPAEWEPAVAVWKDISDPRNDLMHWGMRESPRRPKAIRDLVKALPEQLRVAVKPLGLEVGP